MRPIKFRAWDQLHKKMRYEGRFVQGGISELQLGQLATAEVGMGYILMQFTGLHDKDGTEIWEGDVVKLSMGAGTGYEGNHPWQHVVVGTVAECRGRFIIDDQPSNTQPLYNRGQLKDLYLYVDCAQVLGSIYEHPELVKNVS